MSSSSKSINQWVLTETADTPRVRYKCRKPIQVTHPEHCILRSPRPYHILSRCLSWQHASPSAHCMGVTQAHTDTHEWKTIENGWPGIRSIICISICELFSSQPLSIVLHNLISSITNSIRPIAHVFLFFDYVKLMGPPMA